MAAFKGRHFQGEVILWAVRWYCKYGISYRELTEMLLERGVNVDHTVLDQNNPEQKRELPGWAQNGKEVSDSPEAY